MMLTQDDLALIDGLCSQQEFEVMRRQGSENSRQPPARLPRTASVPLGEALNGQPVDLLTPAAELETELQLKEMVS